MSFSALLLSVAVLAHDPGYFTSLANHLARWLKSEHIAATVSTPATMKAALKNERVAFLVGFAKPTAAEMAALRSFRQRGGKLVVFYSAAPALAELMGVKILGYQAAAYPGRWSRMDFVSKEPQGLPASIRQTSSVLLRAAPGPGGKVLATWTDRSGRPTGDAAWIATNAGYWMTHVLLADGDEDLKARLLGALTGSLVPGLWSFTAHRSRQQAKAADFLAYARSQRPRAGEIHAVWEHSGCGLFPGNWAKTISVLKSAHVTDLFVNVAGAGFAHYPSGLLPRSKIFAEEGDQLAAVLKAAAGSGIRVHAWVLCFSATRGSAERLEVFKQRGWRLADSKGRLTEYLDPAKAEVRSYILSAVEELQTKYPALSGIHLDFVRYGDSAVKPANASAAVTKFLVEARRRVKRPRWLTAAVYGKYPNCVATVGQDWVSWLDMNLIDYAVPMTYTESNEKFREYLTLPASKPSRARRIIAGIGVTANESRLDARKVIEQIRIAREFNLAGEAMFDLDVTLEKLIFPYLRAAIW